MKEKVTVTLDFDLFDKFDGMSLDMVIRWCEAAKEENPKYDKLFLYSYYGTEYQLHLAGKRDINDSEIASIKKKQEREDAKEKDHYKHLKKKFGDG